MLWGADKEKFWGLGHEAHPPFAELEIDEAGRSTPRAGLKTPPGFRTWHSTLCAGEFKSWAWGQTRLSICPALPSSPPPPLPSLQPQGRPAQHLRSPPKWEEVKTAHGQLVTVATAPGGGAPWTGVSQRQRKACLWFFTKVVPSRSPFDNLSSKWLMSFTDARG